MKRIGENIICSDRLSPAAMELLSSFSVSLPTNKNYFALLGFCDVHVHFREPGFSYKGTVAKGSRASARGGYTAVCTMPNLNPVPDTVDNIKQQLALVDEMNEQNRMASGLDTLTTESEGTSLLDALLEKDASSSELSKNDKNLLDIM